MSKFKDIFTGGLVGVFYHDDPTNAALDHESYVEIKECASFPSHSIERNTIEVKSYSSQYNRKLVGKLNVGDLTVECNYIPGDEGHEKLNAAAESGKRVQLKFVYYVDTTKTTGIRTAFNGFISKAELTGGDEEVVKKVYSFVVDGAPVKQEIFGIV